MIAFHICLAVVWAGVSVAFALLARFKKGIGGFRIWPDVLASVCAFIVFIIYVMHWVIGA